MWSDDDEIDTSALDDADLGEDEFSNLADWSEIDKQLSCTQEGSTEKNSWPIERYDDEVTSSKRQEFLEGRAGEQHNSSMVSLSEDGASKSPGYARAGASGDTAGSLPQGNDSTVIEEHEQQQKTEDSVQVSTSAILGLLEVIKAIAEEEGLPLRIDSHEISGLRELADPTDVLESTVAIVCNLNTTLLEKRGKLRDVARECKGLQSSLDTKSAELDKCKKALREREMERVGMAERGAAEREELRNALSLYTVKIKDLEGKLQMEIERTRRLRQHLSDKEKDLMNAQLSIKNLEGKVKQLKAELARAESQVQEFSDIAQEQEDTIKEYENELEGLSAGDEQKSKTMDVIRRERDEAVNEASKLSYERDQLRIRLEEMEERVQEQERMYSLHSAKLAGELQRMHDLSASEKTKGMDVEVALHDAAEAKAQLERLESVLRDFQRERDEEISALNAQLNEQKKAGDAEIKTLRESLVALELSYKELLDEVALRSSPEEQVETLQQTQAGLEPGLGPQEPVQPTDDEESMVDKRIVTQLLITYLCNRTQQDVLELMAKMLNFTDEQKVRVGLMPEHTRGDGNRLPEAIADADDQSSSVKNDDTQTKSLSDLWVDFLMTETDSNK